MIFDRWLNLRAFYTQRSVDANLQSINYADFMINFFSLFMLCDFSDKMPSKFREELRL